MIGKSNLLLLLNLAALLLLSLTATSCEGTSEPHPVPEEGSTEIELISPSDGDYIPGNTITFMWAAVENAENYGLRIIREGDNTVFFHRMTDSVDNNHTVTQFADDGEEYCWHLRVLDNEGWSEWSESNCFINSDAP